MEREASVFKRRISYLLLFVILAGLLAACGSGGRGSATPTPMPLVEAYENAIFTVEEGSIVSEKKLLGEIVPSRQDELFFRASGFITRVTVKSGDVVKKGDILAEMQVDDLLNQLQQARIDLEVAQANLADYEAQRAYDIEKSKADVAIAQARVDILKLEMQNLWGVNLEKAELNLQIAEQNLKLAEEALKLVTEKDNPHMAQAVRRSELAVERLERLLSERQIVAPYDAIVLRVSVRPGTQVDAFYTAFVVGDPSELVVRAPGDLEISRQLHKDTEARMVLNNDESMTVPVKYMPNFLPISSQREDGLNPIPSSAVSASDFFYFTLPEDMTEEEAVVGRQVNLVVVLGRKDNVLLLPPPAIREYRGLHFVIVQDGDTRRRVEIQQIGLKASDKWEVVADLKAGDQVLGP